jgi:cytochrome c553
VSLRQSIIEMPIDVQRFEMRDPHTTYIAYVPKGSIERGRKLARSGGDGRTQPCAACHGPDLKSGPDLEGPPLAGRFATYLFRQLYGFQSGTRAGDTTQPMQTVVAQLTQSDMIDLAAYAASLKP